MPDAEPQNLDGRTGVGHTMASGAVHACSSRGVARSERGTGGSGGGGTLAAGSVQARSSATIEGPFERTIVIEWTGP